MATNIPLDYLICYDCLTRGVAVAMDLNSGLLVISCPRCRGGYTAQELFLITGLSM